MVVWFAVGYLGKQKDEAFAPDKIFFTFVAALIVSLLVIGAKVPEELGQQFYEYMIYRSGLVGLVYKILKVLYVRTGLKAWWDKYSNIEE